MHTVNPLTKQFLFTAKHQEINSLKELQNSCGAFTKLGNFVHQLQKERAMSNVFLTSKVARFSSELKQQIPITDIAQNEFYDSITTTFLSDNAVARQPQLYNLITFSLQTLDVLPALRHQIDKQNVTPEHSTQSFTQLITSLLNIILEVADGTNEPCISRLLIAYFNFIKHKEYAGQERACGAQAFSSSKFTQDQKAKLAFFVQEQSHSISIFNQYADDHLLKCYTTLKEHPVNKQVEQLRSLLQKFDDENAQPLSHLSEVWYEVTSTRFNIMHKIEQNINDHLIDCAAMQIACAQRKLNANKKLISTLEQQYTTVTAGQLALKNHEPTNNSATTLSCNKVMYDLILEQIQHIKKIDQALTDVKQPINEQKVIYQAKTILIKQLKISEEHAHQQLQKQAMESLSSLYEVAKKIIEVDDND